MKLTDKRDATMFLRMPSEMKERIEQVAAEEHRRPTDQVLLILIEHFERIDGAKRKRA